MVVINENVKGKYFKERLWPVNIHNDMLMAKLNMKTSHMF